MGWLRPPTPIPLAAATTVSIVTVVKFLRRDGDRGVGDIVVVAASTSPTLFLGDAVPSSEFSTSNKTRESDVDNYDEPCYLRKGGGIHSNRRTSGILSETESIWSGDIKSAVVSKFHGGTFAFRSW